MKRRSFLSLFGLASAPKVVLAQPKARADLRCGCTGCSSEECGAGLPGLPPTCGAFIVPKLDAFQHGRWICQSCAIKEPAGGWGWDVVTLRGHFDRHGRWQQIHFHETVTRDLWARKLTCSTVSAEEDPDPRVDFVMEVRSDALYRISPSPSPVEAAGNLFDCVAPGGILLRRGSQIAGHFQSPATGFGVYLELHCVRLT